MIKLKDILNEKHVPGHDKEGKMAKFDAKETYQDAIDVFKMIDEYDDLPEWLEAKITKASDYLNGVKDYLTHHHSNVKEGGPGSGPQGNGEDNPFDQEPYQKSYFYCFCLFPFLKCELLSLAYPSSLIFHFH